MTRLKPKPKSLNAVVTDTPLNHLSTGDTKWRPVTEPELERWIADYPRPLIPVPPLSQTKFQVRWWRDPTLGPEEHGDVAMVNKSRRHTLCQVLRDVP